MGIVGNGDQRRIIKPNEPDFTRKPLPSIVAIDNDVIVNNQILPGYGTGIVISPSYILTAAHVIYEKDFGGIGNVNRIRVSSSGNQNRLVDRKIGMGQGDPGENVDVTTGLFYPSPQFLNERANSTEESKHDIGLIEFNNNSSLVSPDLSVGLIAFMSSRTARGRSIQTAGYPVDNVPNTFPPSRLNNPGIVDRQGNQVNQPGDFSRFARDLVIAPGFPDAPGSIFSTNSRRIEYSDNIDTISGQSGSPLWHILEGDGEPRVLGVHSRGNNPRRNVGTLIDKEVYDAIIDRIEGDGNPDDLPENAIIGSDPSIIPVNTPFSSNGNDDIFGTYRKERILGKGGKNRLYGGGGNDRLEGGDDVDQALFTDVFTNYDVITPSNTNPVFEFIHLGGNGEDGIDTTKDIEFGVFEFDYGDRGNIDNQDLFYVPLQVDPNNSTKLKDGPTIRPKKDVLDNGGEKIATMAVESPAWMFDGDVEYTLNLGTEPGEIYNIAYIIDTSGSMSGSLGQVKNAFQDLTQSFIDNGFNGFTTEFAVINFNSEVNVAAPLDINAVIPAINSLSAGGGTNFYEPLYTAVRYYSSPLRPESAINLAYFVSDGVPDNTPYIAQANQLKGLADVRALGIGSANLATLNPIDSGGNATFLNSTGDLFDEFNSPRIDLNNINRIDVKLAGAVINTISPNDLVENGMNFTYEGSIDNLEVSRQAQNEITFELVFNDGTPSVTLDYKITTGQEEIRQQTNNGRTEVITFSVNQNDFFDPQSSIPFSLDSVRLDNEADSSIDEREIVGNDLDNTIQIQRGNNTIFGNGGDDRFLLLGGTNLVNGGEGIDTVVIDLTQAEAGGVSKIGSIINIGTDHTLLNVEYIEFRDVRIATDTLAITPEVSFADKAIIVSEGDAGSTFVTFNLYLSSATTEDVVIDIVSRSNLAETGIDFVSPIEQLTIPAGASFSEITLEILGDLELEGNEEIYLDLTIAAGATFANGVLSETIGVNIVDNEINLVTNEDTPLVILASKLLSDYAEQLYGDFTADDFSLVEVSNSVNGTAIINAEGNVEFTPDANFNGIATFNYTVTDGANNVVEEAEINVIAVDDVLASDDTITTDEDVSITIPASELFSNDLNLNPERGLSISRIDNIFNGTATLNEFGDIEFTPDADFNGIATFDYTVTDGTDISVASVSVVVNAVNDVPILGQDSVTTNEDTPVIISIAELLSNDTDIETPENLSLTEVKNAVNGTVIINENGNIEFTPDANFNGTASFDYTVTDGTDSSTASVSVVVNPINDPLIVNDDTATTDEDVSITILASDLFDNDINPDLKDSRISSINNTVNGTANINAQGDLEFTPDAEFSGIASIDYTVTDGIDSETASVSVVVNAVNDAPILNQDSVTTNEDTPVIISIAELLSNDTDVETPENLSFVGIENPVNGTVIINEDGNIKFTPDANFNGTASFDYTVTDGTDSETASVEVIVNPVNDPLIANDDTVTTDEDTPIVISASELFDNDVNNDIERSLNVSGVNNVVNGTATINSQGDVEFTPDANFNGIATFDYTVTDGIDSETASVEVIVNAVNDVPVANADTFTIDEDTPSTILATELLGNDTDVETQESLSVTEVKSAVNGTVSLNEFGNIEFVPNANFYGTASFEYTLTDNTDNTTGLATVVVNPVNDIPFITTPFPDLTLPKNSPNSVINFADYFEDIEDGDNLFYEVSSSNISISSGTGNLFDFFDFDSETRALILDYADDFVGSATITAKVTDSEGEFAEDTFNITIFETINTDTFTTDEETPLTILPADLLSNDIGDNLSFVGVENAVNGTVILNEDGNIEFAPDPNFDGTATFDYIVSDGTVNKTGLVSVVVNPINDVPFVTTPIPDLTLEKNPPNSVINFADYFEDIEQGDNLFYSVRTSTNIQGGTSDQFFSSLSFDSATRALVLDYEDDVLGTATITAKVTDNEGEIAEDTFTVSIVEFFDIAANNDTVTTDEDTPLTILATELLGNDEGDNLTLVGVDNTVNGTAIINAEGNVEFTPATNFNGTTSFDYTISDGTENATASVSVVVNSINDAPILINPIPNITVNKNAPNSVIELTNYFDDVENGSNLAYSVSSSSSFTGGTSGQFFDLFAIDPSTKALTLDYADDVVGTSTVTVKATDSEGEFVSTSFTVSVTDTGEPPTNSSTMGEYGVINNLTDELQTISLSNNFTNPVVFVQPLSNNESDPATVRLQDIDSDNFNLQIIEPSNLDGIHSAEQVSYLVLEAGNWQLPNGDTLEVGTVESDELISEKWQSITFAETYDSTPAVFSQVQTNNDPDFVQTRQRNITSNGFEFGMEEEEVSKNSIHGMEQLGWFAISSGSGNWSGNDYQAGTTADVVTHDWSAIDFDSDLTTVPQLFASLTTYDGGDPAGVRYQNLDADSVEIKISEDTTRDNETNHTTEQVSFLALEGEGLLEAEAVPLIEGVNVTISEGDIGSTNAQFNFNLSSVPTSDVRFDYTTEDLDAVAGFDYIAASGTVTIPAGSTSASIEVEILGDTDFESDETFNINLSGIEGATFTDNQANYSVLGTIANDDSAPVMGEYGVINNLTDELQTISLSNNFTNPVVFVQPLSNNESDPATVRLQDIDSDNFNLQIIEPSNLDGIHGAEQVSYLVLEAGNWQLPNGDTLEVGTVESDELISEKWQSITFAETYDSTPAVFSQVQTNNDPDFVQTRQRNITSNGFEFGMEEEEVSKNSTHGTEQLGWFAISSGNGNWSGNDYQAGTTADVVTHDWSAIDFDSDLTTAPQLFASLSSYDGSDPAGVRYQNLDADSVEIKISEDTTRDSEINHTTEQVSFLALEGAGLLEAEAIPLLGEMDLTFTEGETREDYFSQSKTETLFAESSSATISITNDSNFDNDETFDLSFPITSSATLAEEPTEYSVLSNLENNDKFFTSSIRDYAFSPVEADF